MKEDALKNREKLYGIRDQLNTGQISYSEALKLAQPTIDSINKKSREIAKKYGIRPQLVDFHSIMR